MQDGIAPWIYNRYIVNIIVIGWPYTYLLSHYITLTKFQYILIIFLAQRFETN